MIARLVRLAGAMTLVALLVLGLSGLWTDPWLWAYLGVWFSLAIYAIASIGDDLARERFSPPEPGADRFYLRAIRLTAIAHLVLGALDVGRWHLFPVPLRCAWPAWWAAPYSAGSFSDRWSPTVSSRLSCGFRTTAATT